MRCSETENSTVPAIDVSELGFTDTDGVLQHRLKDRLKLAWRTANDAKHLRGRGLLLQRLGEVGGTLLQFVEQPRVLNSDDGLCGKVREKLDLLVRKCTRLLTKNSNDSDRLIFVQHGHAERAAVSS